MKLEKFKQRDPKKIGITIFTVVCVLLVAGVFFYTSFASFETHDEFNIIKGTVESNGDLYFAFYVDDEISKTMPQKGEGYVLDKEKTNCTKGASVEFNENDWSVKVLNMTETRTKCTLYFRKQTFSDAIQSCNDTAANCLNNNANLNTVELAYDNTTDNNLRYIGANPNNYVSFNNELWRIIGVFNNIDDGTGTKETRLKIIRSEPIGNYSWDYDSTGSFNNDWTSSQLKDLLNNGAYYNRTTGSYYNNSTTATSVDFTSNGLTEEAKTMINNAKWNLGGLSGASRDENYYQTAITSAWYTNERGTDVYTNRPTEWTGKIGLMYPSDYGYATSGGSTTDRETCLNTELFSWNDYDDCKNNDWLYTGSHPWTLTPRSRDSLSAFSVYSNGGVYSYAASASHVVFPALYLSSNVKISGGEGTENSPYQLSL